METKQTAVEWLFDKIRQNQDIRWRGTPYRDLFEQAKQMEKEQIMEAFKINDNGLGNDEFAEQYYNETYGK
ncbi:MAG: hypothetical protein RIQ51_1779 [Bacteroidota bacterium]|jgi:hypothetical protein